MPGGESRVAVVGAGAAGVLASVRLLTEAEHRRRRIEVLLIDDAGSAGRGVAYATREPVHVLNVVAGRLSALDEDPDHFVRWAERRLDRPVDREEYLSRWQFGSYLGELLADTVHRCRVARLRRLSERVTGLDRAGRHVLLTFSSGRSVDARAAVLATGVSPPGCAWAPGALRASPAFIADPWETGALAKIPEAKDVLLVGTGLTMADMALVLAGRCGMLHAVSRHGLLPRRHAARPAPPLPPPDPLETGGMAEVRNAVVRHLVTAARSGQGWRPAIDGLRPVTPEIWGRLSDGDRERFLTEHVRHWEVHRHRMPPSVAERLHRLRAGGRLRVHTGQVVAAEPDADGVRIELSGGRILRVGAVVNCTGPQRDPRETDDPLSTGLLAAGFAAVGPHGLGFDTAEDGRLRSASPQDLPLWTLGSSRVGNLWESTAFGEIRDQAGVVAEAIMARLDEPVRRRPRDRYGLPLSTTRSVAEVFNDGVGRLLRGQCGALDRLTESIKEDPGFALGQAVVALLRHERGDRAEVPARLRAALAATGGLDERERSFVRAVAARVAEPNGGGGALVRHVADHPRDALAVSVVVPTIAFGGITSGPESWALVEGLADAYGDDWWYLGQLAFVRQEQRRWSAAESLSARALAAEPASGHAAHARTHVFYETGQHRAGLRWLDDWIGRWGAASDGRAHFAWHAALHELTLGDGTAVLRRYARDLAPPAVTGFRALVDSASLVWRCEMTRRWEGRVRDDPLLLGGVPPDWVRRPPSPFAAMHVAIALAVARDVDGLRRLERYAGRHSAATYREVLVPLSAGLAAVVEQRWHDAVALLTSVRPKLGRLGGSAAQREVVEETLVYALVHAGREAEASRVLSARLERRPSPLDRTRLSEFATHGGARPADARPAGETRRPRN
ncbi:FAD/NAD(P)-binding protein [Amycolatopsis lurida]